jgi:hypothetical protein
MDTNLESVLTKWTWNLRSNYILSNNVDHGGGNFTFEH